MDALEINVRSNAGEVASGIANLRSELEQLRSSIKGYNTSAVSRGLEDIAKAINSIDANAVGRIKELSESLYSLRGIDFNGIARTATATARGAERTAQAIERVSHVDGNVIRPIPSAEEQARSAAQAQERINAYRAYGRGVSTTLTDAEQAAWRKIQEQRHPNGYKASEYLDAKKAQKSLSSEASGLTKNLVNVDKELKQKPKDCEKAAKGMDKMTPAVEKTSGAIKNVQRVSVKATKSTGGLLKSIMRIAKYRLIRAALNAIAKGFKEGLDNLYKWDKEIGSGRLSKAMDGMSGSALTMKNALGTALGGALLSLIPLFNALAAAITAVATALSALFSAFSGGRTFYKAKDAAAEYGEAVGGAGGATKDLLADWDELNVIQSQGGGGGGGGGTALADMFEEVEIPQWLVDIMPIIKSVLISGAIALALEKIVDWIKKLFGLGGGATGLLNDLGGIKKVVLELAGVAGLETVIKLIGDLIDKIGGLNTDKAAAFTAVASAIVSLGSTLLASVLGLVIPLVMELISALAGLNTKKIEVKVERKEWDDFKEEIKDYKADGVTIAFKIDDEALNDALKTTRRLAKQPLIKFRVDKTEIEDAEKTVRRLSKYPLIKFLVDRTEIDNISAEIRRLSKYPKIKFIVDKEQAQKEIEDFIKGLKDYFITIRVNAVIGEGNGTGGTATGTTGNGGGGKTTNDINRTILDFAGNYIPNWVKVFTKWDEMVEYYDKFDFTAPKPQDLGIDTSIPTILHNDADTNRTTVTDFFKRLFSPGASLAVPGGINTKDTAQQVEEGTESAFNNVDFAGKVHEGVASAMSDTTTGNFREANGYLAKIASKNLNVTISPSVALGRVVAKSSQMYNSASL